jgi:hypothetical protein
MYTVLANAMGGARLKTKFQTKEVVHKRKSPPKEKSPKMKKRATSKSEKKSVKKRPSSAVMSEPRRNIKKVLAEAELSHSVRGGLKDNLFLSNCDTWSNVHCHRPKSGKKSIIVRNIE